MRLLSRPELAARPAPASAHTASTRPLCPVSVLTRAGAAPGRIAHTCTDELRVAADRSGMLEPLPPSLQLKLPLNSCQLIGPFPFPSTQGLSVFQVCTSHQRSLQTMHAIQLSSTTLSTGHHHKAQRFAAAQRQHTQLMSQVSPAAPSTHQGPTLRAPS